MANGYYSEVCIGNRRDTLMTVSGFMMMPHIRRYSDARLYIPYYIHNLFHDIENGFVTIIKTSCGEVTLGFEMGVLRSDGLFEHHAFWARNADGYQCIMGAKRAYEAYCEEKKLDLKGYVSNIPKCNRAARILAKRFGCFYVPYEDGDEKKDFVDYDGDVHQCDSYYMRTGE